MASGGKRVGSGRKEKYSKREKLVILDVCKKVWQSKTKDTDHVVIQINKDTEKITSTEIWSAEVTGSNITEFAAIEEPKTSMKKIMDCHTQLNLHNNLFERPKNRDQCVKLAQIIISKLYPERYHRANTIDKIWKQKIYEVSV